MEELDVRGLEIFGQERTLYLLFKLREKSQIFLIYAIDYDLGDAESQKRNKKAGGHEKTLYTSER